MARRTPPSRLIGSGLIPQDYQDEYNKYENDYTSQLAGLGQEQSNLFQDYGFAGGIDPQGGVNFSTDPNNRFGKYQQLIQSIGAQIESARSESTGRGIGKRGLAKARERLIKDMSAGDKSSLVNNFSRSASGIFGRRGEALGTRDRGFASTEGRALDWWNQYGPEDPNAVLDVPPVTDPGGGGDPNTSPGPSGGPTDGYPTAPNASLTPQTSPQGYDLSGTADNPYAGLDASIAAAIKANPGALNSGPVNSLSPQYLPGQAPTSLAVMNNYLQQQRPITRLNARNF